VDVIPSRHVSFLPCYKTLGIRCPLAPQEKGSALHEIPRCYQIAEPDFKDPVTPEAGVNRQGRTPTQRGPSALNAGSQHLSPVLLPPADVRVQLERLT
jgi:hypothetical protein